MKKIMIVATIVLALITHFKIETAYSLTFDQKALDFENNLRLKHLSENQLLALVNPSMGFDEKGDSCFWTSLYIASEAYRYQVTADTVAYANMANGLNALNRLQTITGIPGLVARYIENNSPLDDPPSKDVYTGITFAYFISYSLLNTLSDSNPDLNPKPSQLKQMIKDDMEKIGNHFINNNYSFVGTNCTYPNLNKTHVNLNPYLTLPYLLSIIDEKDAEYYMKGENYALKIGNKLTEFIDDANENELISWLDYYISYWQNVIEHWNDESNADTRAYLTKDELIFARALLIDIKNITNPIINGGVGKDNEIKVFIEAMRLSQNKNDLNNAIINNWNNGLNELINRVLTLLKELPNSITPLLKIANHDSPGKLSELIDNLTNSDLKALFANWLQNQVKNEAALSDLSYKLPNHIDTPEDLKILSSESLLNLHILKVAGYITGDTKYVQAYNNNIHDYLITIKTWGNVQNELIEKLFDSESAAILRVSGTHHLPWLARHDLIQLEQDPAIKNKYIDDMEDSYSYIKTESNAFYNFIHNINCNASDIYEQGKKDGIISLELFPIYKNQLNIKDPIENPDQFGGKVKFFSEEGTRDPVPINYRPRDFFSWQRSPRRLGSNGYENHIYPGIDYLLCYWMGRHYGIQFSPHIDLGTSMAEVSFSNNTPNEGETIVIGARVSNVGTIDADNVRVGFYDNNPDINGDNIPDDDSKKIGEAILAKIPFQSTYTTISLSNISGNEYSTSGYRIWTFLGAPGVSNGIYIVKQREIRCNINYGVTFNNNPALTISSTGWSDARPNNGSNWYSIISQSTTGCVLRTYVYELWDINLNHLGWYPSSNASFTFSATGYVGGNYADCQIQWDTTNQGGSHNIYVWIDSDDAFIEPDENNNIAAKNIEVQVKLPPEVPYFFTSNPTSGFTNTAYSFSAASRDPNGDSIKFEFTWADGSISSTAYGNYGANGYVTLSITHTWTQEGIFGIQVRAIDTNGMKSEWSAPWSMMIKQRPGWGSYFPLSPITTEPPLPSSTLISKFPDISCDNSGNVYTVWFGQYDTNGAIYYRKLINKGSEAYNAIVMSNVTRDDNHFPVIESDKAGKLQLLWNDLRAAGNWEIYRLGSADQGGSWSFPDENFSYTSANSKNPNIAVNGQNIHAVWSEGNNIYYKKSSNGGTTWSNARVIITTPFFNVNSRPNLVCDGAGNVFLVWAGQMPNVAWAIKNAYFSYSKNNGDTWQPTQQIYSDNGFMGFELNPDITQDSAGNIHIVYDTKSDQIFYRKGSWSNGSIILSSPIIIENNYANSEYPNIVVDGSDSLYVFWQDTRNGNREIYYKFKKAADPTWGSDTRITNATGASLYPKAAISNGYAHLVWQDNRNGNFQIYYNRMRLRCAPWVTQVSAPHFDVPPYDEDAPPYVNNDLNQTSISFKLQDDSFNQHKVSVWIYNVDGSVMIKTLITDQIVNLDSSSDPNWPFSKYFQNFVTWDGRDENGNYVPESTSYKVKISVRAVDDTTIEPSDGLPGLIGTNWANIDTTNQEYVFTDPTFVQPNRKNIKAWHEFIRQ